LNNKGDLLELKNTTSYDYYQDIKELVETSPSINEDPDDVHIVGNLESPHSTDYHTYISSH
jgi:hypothetical protein